MFDAHVEFGGEQGLLGLAFHPKLRAEPALLRRLHVERRPEHRRPLSLERERRRCRRAGRSCSPSPIRTETTTAASSPSAADGMLYTTIGDGGSGGDPEDRAQDMRSLFGKLLRLDVSKPQARLGESGSRAPESLAVLVRPPDGRPVHRRRRAGSGRGDRLHACARAPDSRTTAGTCTRDRSASRTASRRGRASSSSRCTSTVVTRGTAPSSAATSIAVGQPRGARALHLRRLLQRGRLEPERELGRGAKGVRREPFESKG